MTDAYEADYGALLAEWRAVADLDGVVALLDWDQATYLPDGGSSARGRQLAMLGELAHARRVGPAMTSLLAACRPLEDEDSARGAVVRRTRRRVERASRLPASLVAESKEHFARTYVAWTAARPARDFAAVRPLLERTLELSRRIAEAYGYADHPLDALIEESDEGMTVARTAPLFEALTQGLRPLVDALADRPAPALPAHSVGSADQLAFARTLSAALGYDAARGRVDLTHHPFMIRLSGGDVRVTTRVREDDLTEVLFSTVHEVGHALYEQGLPPEFEGTALFDGASSGIHESQSRFLENVIGRSHAFARFVLPKLAAVAPAFGSFGPDDFTAAVNAVRRTRIRTDADEVTYNLHVALRFDLERALFDGRVSVAELPEAWAEGLERRVGVRPTDLADGVLQDVHWFSGPIGGVFQGYTLGNLFAAQLRETLVGVQPDFEERVAEGDFTGVHAFLRDRVHRHGARYAPAELVERATGAPLAVEPFLRYLRRKHGLPQAG